MNVEIGAEAALFPEKEYINGIAVAVWDRVKQSTVDDVSNGLKNCIHVCIVSDTLERKRHNEELVAFPDYNTNFDDLYKTA
jgi:hypothetical protein